MNYIRIVVVLLAGIASQNTNADQIQLVLAPTAGRVNMDIHASDVIWSFFSAKQLER